MQTKYHIHRIQLNPCPAELDISCFANSVDPDQLASDLDLHCLPSSMQIYNSNLDQVTTLAENFVCVEFLWPIQPNGVMLSTVSLPNHTFTGQA